MDAADITPLVSEKYSNFPDIFPAVNVIQNSGLHISGSGILPVFIAILLYIVLNIFASICLSKQNKNKSEEFSN